MKTEIYEDTELTTDVFSMAANTPPTSHYAIRGVKR